MSFLLDTNALSEMRKIRLGRADPKVAAWSEQVSARDLFVSVITLQEIEQGLLLLQRRDAAQAGALRHWFDAQVLPLFAGRTLPVTTEIALCCARLNVPDPKPYRDGLIAATALVHGLTVVTRNEGDFSATGAALLNPWNWTATA
jgi:predicted nucleic acid-binding protein